MALGDERIWKIDQPIGVRSQADQRSINIERQRAQFLGKAMREARRNKDLQGYLDAEAAGYKDRGIENVDDKNRRYLDKVQQDRFYGDAAVGPGQRPTGGSQPPTGGGTQPPAGAAQTQGGGTQPPAGAAQPSAGGQPAAPVMSAAEQSKQATLEKTLAGNFGKVAQARAQAQQSGGTYDATPGFDTRTEGRSKFVDTIKGLTSPSDENLLGMMTEEQEKQAREQGAKLGLSEDQINDTINGEGDLSPKAVAERAKGRKDAAYQKEFAESDKKWAEYIKDRPADQKAMLEGLSPQEKKDALAKGKEIAKGKIDSAKAKSQLAAEEYKYSGEQDKHSVFFDKVDALGERAKEASDVLGKSAERTRSVLAEIDKDRKERDALAGIAMSEYEAAKNKSPDKPQRPRPDMPEARPDHVYGQSLSGDFGQAFVGFAEGMNALLSGASDVLGGAVSWTGDRVINAGNYITNPETRVPTRAEIRDFAESRGVSYKKGLDIFFEERAKRNLEKKGWLPKSNGDGAPQTSINIGKIQGSYEKAFRGADDILFGLSFDQRKV
jgi:hypothetical protein